MKISLTFVSNLLEEFWSSPVALTAGTASILLDSLHVYVAGREPTIQIPSIVSLPYRDYQIFTQEETTLRGPNTPFTFNFNTVVVNVVPSTIYIFARQHIGGASINRAVHFAVPTSLTMRLNSYSGLLAGTDEYQLRKLSYEN